MQQQGHHSERRPGVAYRAEAPLPCAECGCEQWFVGRHVVECAGCAAPLPRACGDPVGMPRPRLLRRAA
jgi:hypothetical protein